MTDRWRCKSIPTNCLTSYSSIGASYDSWNVNTPASAGNVTRSGGPAPSSHQVNWSAWWCGSIVRVLCVVLVERPVPLADSGGSRGRRPGDLVPDHEAAGHDLSVVGRRQQVPTGPKVRRDAAERRQEPLRMPGRLEAFHRPLALPGRLMRVLGPVVQIPRPPVGHRRHELAVRHLVAGELVGDDH